MGQFPTQVSLSEARGSDMSVGILVRDRRVRVLLGELFLSPRQEETVLLRRPLGKLSPFLNLKAGGTPSP